jgi:hypothetical protein
MNRFLDFTGSEKAAVALGPIVLPLTVLIQALMAWGGLGEMPDAIQIRDAIVYFAMTVGFARLVWQVPNSDVVKADTVEVKIPETSLSEVTVGGPTAAKTKTTPKPKRTKTTSVVKPTVEVEVQPVKVSTIEENPV